MPIRVKGRESDWPSVTDRSLSIYQNFISEHYQFDPTRKWLWRRNVKSSSKLLFTFERFFKRKVERKTTFIATYNARANRISSLLINYYYGKYMSHKLWVICGDLLMQDSQNHDMRELIEYVKWVIYYDACRWVSTVELSSLHNFDLAFWKSKLLKSLNCQFGHNLILR